MTIVAVTVVSPPFCFPFKCFKGVGEQNNSFNKLNIYILSPYHVPGTVLGFNLGSGNISSEHNRQTPPPLWGLHRCQWGDESQLSSC